jgi:hypothetical protein
VESPVEFPIKMKHSASLILLALLAVPGVSRAQVLSYPDPSLDFVYPAGGQIGQVVPVELGGNGGLQGATQVLVEGPPGVSVAEFKTGDYYGLTATLVIAPDAVPGPCRLRVLGGTNGLTNYRFFHVGRLPEVVEAEPNNEPETAQEVPTPAVINGRIHPTLDLDCYRFKGRGGQRIMAAILAHGLDTVVRDGYLRGYLDTSLELLDEKGGVLTAAEDTAGLDPVLEFTLPADDLYGVRVKSLSYKGSRTAVYRLTIGEVPYATSVFPPGGQRGQTVEVELAGPTVPRGTRQNVAVPADDRSTIQHVSLEAPGAGRHELPFIRGDYPESIETEPNNAREAANGLSLPLTANGRFDRSGDEDWYRLTLAKGQGVTVSTLAQRHLRAPVDTAIEIYDAAGMKLAENDDASLYMGQVWHDYESHDSRQAFAPAADGDYFIRIRDQAGASGPQAVYRLTVEPYGPDFCLFQWPDAVPIWGPGTTAAFVTQVFAWGGLKADIEVTVEGLPPGWQGSSSPTPAAYFGPYLDSSIGTQPLLTITAPADAPLGMVVPFRVVGRAVLDGRIIEHEAQYLTLYGNSHNDRMFLRYSDGARTVVTQPMDCRLETTVTELTVPHGGTVEIPVKVFRNETAQGPIGLGIDGMSVFAGSGWRPPLTLGPDQNELMLPLTVSPEWRPGVYPIVVSRAWAADLRNGRPGPCTPVIRLTILPP